MQNDSPIEWVFVIASLGSCFVTGWFYVRASTTMRWHLLDGHDGPVRIVAMDKQRGSGLRFMQALVALVTSIAVLFTPPPPPPYSEIPQSLILIAAFIISKALTILTGWLSWQSQRDLEAYDEHKVKVIAHVKKKTAS